MRYLTVRSTDGQAVQFEDQPLNSGGEKVVFPSRDRRQVVGFYFGQMRDRLERVDRLNKILTKYNPTTDRLGGYWSPYFCWPTGVVDGDPGLPADFLRAYGLVSPALGVIAPVYRPPFFFHDRFGRRQEKEVKWFTGTKASAFVPEAERGNLLTRLQICTRLARAVRRMHFAGLAHADLSNKNVLIDPKTGDACVIDIDSLVVPGVAPPTVLGTPGYIAPEVLSGTAQPSIATDKHALAVLIYQILLSRHPLMGTKVHSTKSAEEDERLSMGSRAVFVEHPADRSNPPIHPIRVPMSRLGPHLEQLLLKTFVQGLHAPSRRADAAEWETALYRTLDLLHPTPSGREWFVLGPGMPRACPVTGERVAHEVPVAHYFRELEGRLADEQQSLVLFHNLVLHDWHIHPGVNPGEQADRTPRGYFARHQGRWWLVNLQQEPIEVAGRGSVARNAAVELSAGLELRMPGAEQRRVLRITFHRP